MIEDDPHHGPLAARFNLRLAVEARSLLGKSCFETRQVEWYLYFASAIIFCRAALDAMRNEDGGRNKLILEEWTTLFWRDVEPSPLFKEILGDERHRLAHGKAGVALHPFQPFDTVMRHGGLTMLFEEMPPRWPDGGFAGWKADDLLDFAIRQVGRWIDEVDAQSSKRAPPYGLESS